MSREKTAVRDDLLQLSQRFEEWRNANPPRTRCRSRCGMRRWRFSDNPNSFARVDRLVSSPNLPFGKGRRMVIKNRLVDAVIGGWQVGGITTWRSGFHINPSAGVNRANTNINVDRPDATGKPVGLDTPTTKQWFNTAAFALQPIYQFGNAARNSVPRAG